MTKTIRHNQTVSARIHGALLQNIDEIKRKRDIDTSTVLKEALSIYIDRMEGIEPREPVQKIFNQSEAMKDAKAEDYYIQNQNFKISTKLKELTFLEFMDKNLAIVYMANKPHMSEEQLVDHLTRTLETLKDRAEHHGYEKQWENRKEDPIAYVNDFLDRKNLEDKAFSDWKESMGMK